MLYKLHYFKKAKGICADDLRNNPTQIDMINLSSVSSLSGVASFYLPFSGNFVGKYSVLTMNNGDIYYIHENSFKQLRGVLDSFLSGTKVK